MFIKSSFVNTVGEYAYDCDNRYDMLLRVSVSSDSIEINTQYGSIVVSSETLVCTGKGLWKRADELHVGDSIKHYLMNRSVITGITRTNEPIHMFKLVDCTNGYLVIDGFYLSED